MTKRKSSYVSRGPGETIEIGKQFAGGLRPGDVVRLEGDLGAGKTTFMKGLALGLGVEKADEVKSPTFVIMHIYKSGRVPVYHFDLYRLEGDAELGAIGFEDFIADASAVTCVEWAEKASSLFPSYSFRVLFRMLDGDTREITVIHEKD